MTENKSNHDIVCPFTLKTLGKIQSYRCQWRKNVERPDGGRGMWETRPQKGADDWYEPFMEKLHEVVGPEAKVFKFTHEQGLDAKQKAIELVNTGKIKAPKKNWDKVFMPDGGLPKDQLKEQFPELYGETKETRKTDETKGAKESESSGEGSIEEKVVSEASKEETKENQEGLIEAEESSRERTYAVEEAAVAEAAQEHTTEQHSARVTMTDPDSEEDHVVVVNEGGSTALVYERVIKWKDNNGDEHIAFRVEHPHNGMDYWLEDGIHDIDGASIDVLVEKPSDK